MVWLGGTFGAGKTTTGRLLVERAPGLRLFDPEWVGFLLREHLADRIAAEGITDFQQLPSWRRLVPVVAAELADATGQALVAVQSVLVEDYWRELRAGLEADGFEVVHLLLHADDATLRRRIEGDRVEAGARDWRLRHLAAYDAARPWLHATADLVLDTTDLTPDEVAGRVLGHVGWGSTEV
ncbi:MAG: ATP-binding protein [Nocardioides sp.]|nr:ATP-binding protein [Nocardioides sp.]